jgi:rSAM/selenodomain-associated transferase 2
VSAADAATPLRVSIVVPVLNEAPRLPGLLAQLQAGFPDCEVILVDGGSTDGSPDLVRPPARLVPSARGRGRQLNAGAAAATGDVLWFHHADTYVEPAAMAQVRGALADPGVVGGGLSLRFDRRTPALAWVAATSNARARRLHQIFGDQAMFVRREVFERLGGFPDFPVMEDLELSRRLARVGRLAVLPATSTASARRFTEHGTLRLLIFMQWLKVLYFAGVDPADLARRYAAGPPRLRRRPGAAVPAGSTPEQPVTGPPHLTVVRGASE